MHAVKRILPALLLSACSVSAFPSFEPFADATGNGGTFYAAGAALYHQTNAWGEGWAQWNGGSGSVTAAVSCMASNLNYTGFPPGFPAPPTENAVLLPGTASAVSGYSAALQFSRTITADPNNLATNKIYASFLMQVPNLGNLNSASPIYFGGFATNTGDQALSLPARAMKLFLKGNSATSGASTSYSIGIQNASGAGTAAAYEAGSHVAGDVVFLVMDYEFGFNGGPDVANLWINPPGASFGANVAPVPAATFSTSSATSQLISAADFYLLARSGATIWGTLLMGDLRIGDSWSYATGAPEIITAPANQTNTIGGTALFTVNAVAGATNVSPLSYQWEFNGTNLDDGGNIAGSAGPMLSLSDLTLNNGGTYSVVVSNSLRALTNSAVLTMIDLAITTNPVNQTASPGGTVTFSIGASGATPLSYQWQENGTNLADGPSVSGTSFAGTHTSALNLSNISSNDNGSIFTCAVTNGAGSGVVSAGAALTVANTNLLGLMDYLSVKSFGAKGDGVTDDTAAFLAAIAAAGSQKLNGVYIPMGKYVISSSVALKGLELIGRFAGGWPADTMPLPTLLIRQYTAPGLALTNGASLHGLAIVYDQKTPITTNAPAISDQGGGTTLSSLRIQNAYDGITSPRADTPGRARYSDILIVQPGDVGIEISKSFDFVQYRHIEVRCPGTMSAGAAFRFGRVDEGGYVGLAASNCAIGLEFFTDTDSNGGTFTGGFAACSVLACGTAVSAIGDHKIKIAGGDFAGLNYGAVINGTNAEVIIAGGKWQAGNNQAIQVAQGANVVIDANVFCRPGPVSNPLVQIQNCTTITVKDCQFLPGSTGLELDSQVQRAIVCGNSFEDGGIINNMILSKSVLAANLVTPGPPTSLAATAGNGQVALNWNGPLGSVTSYHVKRALVTGGPYTVIGNLTVTNFTDSHLTNGTTYYYVVSAIKSGSESANSNEAGATPEAPLQLTAVLAPDGHQLALSWPGWASNYNLYTATNLSAPVSWQAVTNAPQSSNGTFNLNLPINDSGQQFYRLFAP